MSPPKHLWSGDWQRESAAGEANAPTTAAWPLEQPDAQPPAGGPEPGRPRRRPGPRALAAAAVLLVAVAVGVTLAATLPGSSPSRTVTLQGRAFPFGQGGNSGGTQLFPQPQQSTPRSQAPQQQPTTPQQQPTIPQQQPTTPQQQPTTPQQQSAPQPSPAPAGPSEVDNWLGMQIDDNPEGVVIDTVTLDSAPDRAGLDPGDVIQSVNGTQIASLGQLRKLVGKLALGSDLKLTVDRGTTLVTATVKLTGRPKRRP